MSDTEDKSHPFSPKRHNLHPLLADMPLSFQEAIGALPLGIYWKDRHQRYEGRNQGFAETLGVGAEELQGKTDSEVIGDDFSQLQVLSLPRGPTGARGFLVQWTRTTDNHSVLLARTNLFDQEGHVIGMTGFVLTHPKSSELISLPPEVSASIGETLAALSFAISLGHSTLGSQAVEAVVVASQKLQNLLAKNNLKLAGLN